MYLVAMVSKIEFHDICLYFCIRLLCFFNICFCIWLLGSDDDVIPEADENGEPEEELQEEEYYDDLYCVACNRAFKTDKA